MILYRYLASHWMDTLRNEQLKVARPQEFNDPYDCLGVCVGQYPLSTVEAHFLDKDAPVYATTIQTAKGMGVSIEIAAHFLAELNVNKMSIDMGNAFAGREYMDGIMFLLCFSSCEEGNSGHSLMWSHYANKCNGVRLGFDFGGPEFENYLSVVKYSSERATLNLSLVTDFINDFEYRRFNEDKLTTKSIEWAYEREYRMMVDDRHSESGKDDKGNAIRFWRFKPQYLQTIDLGFGIGEEEQNEILSIVQKQYPHVKVRRLQMSQTGYSFALKSLN